MIKQFIFQYNRDNNSQFIEYKFLERINEDMAIYKKEYFNFKKYSKRLFDKKIVDEYLKDSLSSHRKIFFEKNDNDKY